MTSASTKRMGAVVRLPSRRKAKPATTMTVRAVHDALRGEVGKIFSGLVTDLAKVRATYAPLGADAVREAVSREVGYSWGMLLGLRCAAYAVRRECEYGGDDWRMFERLIGEIGDAMEWVQGARS